MIGRERNRKAPSADLLVCFPTRSHLALMPKPTCSPSRPNEPNKRFLNHHIRKSNGSSSSSSSHRNTSMLLSKNKHMESDMSEPTSPKVTCAGQIKVRPRNGGSCKNWQSVMEEIEKLHNNKKKTKKVKKPGWMEALGFKKDVMQFLTCLRTVRFDFRCFGSFPSANVSSSDDEDDDTDDEDDEVDDEKFEKNQEEENEDENSKAVFSKWFMVLQENQNTKEGFLPISGDDDHVQYSASVPPSNALLLMRCRSAPAKSWLEEKEEEEHKEEEEEEEEEKENEREAQMVNEEEGSRKMILEENNLVVMNYDTDFYKLSSDIAKETWVVSGINKDQMSRSRSCKR